MTFSRKGEKEGFVAMTFSRKGEKEGFVAMTFSRQKTGSCEAASVSDI
jgi:hypothetical protein